MAKRRRSRLTLPSSEDLMGDINITPLTDVLLVLLIIFLVTATSANQNAFNMNMPLGSSKATIKVATDVVVVSIDDKGQIYLQEELKPVDNPPKTLIPRLKLYQVKKGTQKVAVRADGMTDYGTVVMVIDAAKQAGLSQVVLVAG